MRNKVTILIFLTLLAGSLCGQHQMYVETYDAAERLYRKAQYGDAYGLFSQVFLQSSDKDLRAKSLYMKALSSFKQKKYSTAASDFEEFIHIFPDHPLIYRAALWAAEAYFNADTEPSGYLNAAQNLAFAMLSDNPKVQLKANNALENILWGYLPEEYFPSLLDRVDRSVEGLVAVWWLRRLQHDGEYAKALREGQKLLQRVYDMQSKRRLQDELGKIESYLAEHLVVAVLVPFGGDFAQFGNDVRRGVEMAFSSSDRSIEVKVLDSGGDPLTTARQMDKLLRSTTPLCIIGPITSNETVAAGALAGTYKVPLITPSASRDGIAEISKYIFQLATSPVKAAAYLAEFAVDTMDSFAILAPDDELGHECAMAFASVVAEHNGTIVGAQFYPEGTADFSSMLAEIKEPILKYYDEHWRAFDTLDAALYKCDADSGCRVKPREEWLVHIDGFFLPAYYDEISVILPQIPFMYIDTKILGVNGWVVDDLRKKKGLERYLDGSFVVPDDFYIWSDNLEWRSFSMAYKRKYGAAPSRIAALGYDAASLVLKGIENKAVTQELMRDFLSGIHNFKGAAGRITFDENGANTDATILLFIGDEPIPIDKLQN